MPPSKMEVPNYRVLHVIEVPPEVVTSSYDAGGSPRSQNPQRTTDPASQSPREGRVFPQYIYLNYQGFMQTADPFWEPNRLPTSCLYTSNSDQKGHVSCSERMAKWLDGLPGPGEESLTGTGVSSQLRGHQHQGVEESREKLRQGQLPRNKPKPKPSVQSISGPVLISSTHPMGAQVLHRPGQPNPGVPISPPSTSDKGGSASPRLHHPNPLGLHPVVLEELPIQARIPKRKSSLRCNLKSSHLNPPAHSTTIASAPDDLIRGVQSIQLGKPVPFLTDSERAGEGPRESDLGDQLDSQLDQDASVTEASSPARIFNDNNRKFHDPAAHQSLTSHVELVFGQASGKTNPKKHARSEVSPISTLTPRMRAIPPSLPPSFFLLRFLSFFRVPHGVTDQEPWIHVDTSYHGDIDPATQEEDSRRLGPGS